jgi:hypothetical protein
MKKILSIILLFILFSCDNNESIVISKDEYNKLKGQEYPKRFYFKDKKLNQWEWQIVLGQDNHEYLTNDEYNSFAIIHYPDCKKCLSDTTKFKK